MLLIKDLIEATARLVTKAGTSSAIPALCCDSRAVASLTRALISAGEVALISKVLPSWILTVDAVSIGYLIRWHVQISTPAGPLVSAQLELVPSLARSALKTRCMVK